MIQRNNYLSFIDCLKPYFKIYGIKYFKNKQSLHCTVRKRDKYCHLRISNHYRSIKTETSIHIIDMSYMSVLHIYCKNKGNTVYNVKLDLNSILFFSEFKKAFFCYNTNIIIVI